MSARAPVAAPPPRDVVDAMGDEARWFVPLARAYETYFGRALRAQAREGGGFVVTFDPVDDPRDAGALLRPPATFRRHAPLRDYVAALGFEADARDGLVRTVPSPETFAARARALGAGALGYAPRVVPSRAPIVTEGAWLASLARGVVPINVGTAGFYRATAPLRRAGLLRALWGNHFHALAHDMGVHALVTHRAPRAHADALGARVAATLAGLKLRAGAFVPAPLLRFYEEDLVQHCLAIWRECERPEDFDARYDAARPALDAQLDRRVAQVRAGTVFGVYARGAHARV